MECTPLTLTGLGRDSVPKITVHHYAKDSALREPQTSSTRADLTTAPTSTDCSEQLPEEFPEFNSVEDLRQWLGIDDNTSSEDLSPEEDMSPEEELLAEFNLELLGSPEEGHLPEFNWTEDLRQYLEL